MSGARDGGAVGASTVKLLKPDGSGACFAFEGHFPLLKAVARERGPASVLAGLYVAIVVVREHASFVWRIGGPVALHIDNHASPSSAALHFDCHGSCLPLIGAA